MMSPMSSQMMSPMSSQTTLQSPPILSANGVQDNGNLVITNQVNAEQSNDNQSNGNQPNGNQSNGDQLNVDQSNVNQLNNNQLNNQFNTNQLYNNPPNNQTPLSSLLPNTPQTGFFPPPASLPPNPATPLHPLLDPRSHFHPLGRRSSHPHLPHHRILPLLRLHRNALPVTPPFPSHLASFCPWRPASPSRWRAGRFLSSRSATMAWFISRTAIMAATGTIAT